MSRIVLLCVFMVLISCKKETVQTYLFEAEQKPEFVAFDLSSNLLNLSKLYFDKEHTDTFNTIRKVKLIGLPINKAKDQQYETEKERLNTILANSEYKKLMSFKKDNQQIKIFYNGAIDDIDEFIAFAYSDQLGLGLARILGDNMNPEAIVEILDDKDLNSILNGNAFE